MKSKEREIAVIGMACKYPDMGNCTELWENVLAGRRSFRNFPEVRMSAEYFSADDPDKVYAHMAAVLSGYEFDRSKYGISGKNYRSADLTHWLALDIATIALQHAGLLSLNSAYKDQTGVYVGNTLTGEFSRANLMRLRWPFVQKKVKAQLLQRGWAQAEIEDFLIGLETDYKSPFSAMSEDSLAGGLSNTIAGRICNYHDFHGGGYTVDGACSSSLLAVIEACKSISSGENLVALAGGVDLSLDPFELVGFSRAGALARREMLVYDQNSNGFWPGEGCGFVVLADLEFAKQHQLPVYALIKGYGISSDGQGGLTRPAVSGQTLAMQRAYDKAGYTASAVTYFEGHGTGTELGDQVELQTIISHLKLAGAQDSKHYIGSIKGNIGHTKAAAGIAGLLKIIAVVQNKIVPPITGCINVHELLHEGPLKAPFQNIPYTGTAPMKASVSAMGFGGINTHITIEAYQDQPQTVPPKPLSSTIQASWPIWLFLFAAGTKDELLAALLKISAYAATLSKAELADLSKALFQHSKTGTLRAGIMASGADELFTKLGKLQDAIIGGADMLNHKGIFFYNGPAKKRIGFLFPGQGSKSFAGSGGMLHLLPWMQLPTDFPIASGSSQQLDVTQPAIVGTALLSVSLLEKFGITATLGLGHSLGEIAALSWTGVLTSADAMALAKRRGEIMQNTPGLSGLMLIIAAGKEDMIKAIAGTALSIAAVNSSRQTVVSGPADQVNQLKKQLSAEGISSALLPVKYAFHSAAMALAADQFAEALDDVDWRSPRQTFVSSVTAQQEESITNIKDNLSRQLSAPVQFMDAVKAAVPEVDFWIELGGDQTLAQIMKNITDQPVSSIMMDGDQLNGLFASLTLCWVFGHNLHWDLLFDGLFARDFKLDYQPGFLMSPCEADGQSQALPLTQQPVEVSSGSNTLSADFIGMIASKLELSIAYIDPGFRFLDDLHLNSLEVAQLIASFALSQNIVFRGVLTEYANASIAEVIDVLLQLAENPSAAREEKHGIPGIFPWIHYFEILQQSEQLSVKPVLTAPAEPGFWTVLQHSAATLGYDAEEAKVLHGTGLLINLQNCSEPEVLQLIEEMLLQMQNDPSLDNIIIVQSQPQLGGVVKSIFLENSQLNILLITSALKPGIPILQAEFEQVKGFKEVIYTATDRLRPVFQPKLQIENKGKIILSENDVVLITAGAKGITAECALAMGKIYKATFILVGRTAPQDDRNLQNNLQRFESASIKYQYYQADIADQEDVERLVQQVQDDFGPISALIHGAGINRPGSWRNMGLSEINATCRPKLYGFRNLITSCSEDLKLVITFGSVIAESGMKGNADYALANEWLRNELIDFADQHPACNCLHVAWSVWSGAGMGEHLGVLEQLIRDGIQPIALEQGLVLFMSWMDNFPASPQLIVSGRYGNKATLNVPKPVLPITRYLENILLFYPGLELISEVELSEQTDLYLADHSIGNEAVFPAVMGLEAMLQVAAPLTEAGARYSFADARFAHPIMVPKGQKVTVRIVALRLSADQLKVVIRCSTTDFCQDHFEAVLQKDNDLEPAVSSVDNPSLTTASLVIDLGTTHSGSTGSLYIRSEDEAALQLEHYADLNTNINVETDLYQRLLFHKGIFRVIRRYTRLSAYHCIAEARPVKNTRYFSDFMSAETLSFEPSIRDAALHCVQACVPEYRILPIGFKKLSVFYPEMTSSLFTIEAIERYQEDKLYVYDIAIRTENNELLEYWEAVQFKVLDDQKQLTLPLALVSVISERRLDQLTGSRVEFRMISSKEEFVPVLSRYDGKPLLQEGHSSKTHMGPLAIQVLTNQQIGCDLEKVSNRTAAEWLAILGDERYKLALYVSSHTDEAFDIAATRIWGLMESIKKAGLNIHDTLLFKQKLSPALHYYTCAAQSLMSLAYLSAETRAQVIFTVIVVQELNKSYHEKI